ncbi:uncharacterized protein LOC135199968 isoform X2 [Macrobrachium nipponense]|uniref:uncharacterized protein LOC135199968 isoform X2 n=1 Tax=Macrobrachium nipponense TaxID=159736 RepID=UPI0030C85448
MSPSRTSTTATTVLLILLNFDVIQAFMASVTDFSALKIRMVRESKAFSTFILAPDVAIPQAEGFHSYTAVSFHDCRMTCWASVNCKSLSVQPTGSTFLCVLSNRGPLDDNIMSSSGASYIFKVDSLNANWMIMPDGISYIVHKRIPLNFTAALSFCRRIPGHDIGVFQTTADTVNILNLGSKTGASCAWTNNKGAVADPVQTYYNFAPPMFVSSNALTTCSPFCRAHVVE